MTSRKRIVRKQDNEAEWSDGERAFMTAWRMVCQGLPEPVHEFRFHPVRKWRFDFAFPDYGVAVEVEGGVFSRGRHTRGAGYSEDLVKYNAANDCGFVVYRYSTKQITDDPFAVVSQVAHALTNRMKVKGYDAKVDRAVASDYTVIRVIR
jgi:very-short-patch-repair endonuclease